MCRNKIEKNQGKAMRLFNKENIINNYVSLLID